MDIPIVGMVNRQLHEAEWLRRGTPAKCPCKCPPWFGISVHVDNEPGIEAEGRVLGYRLINADPTTEKFAQIVRKALEAER